MSDVDLALLVEASQMAVQQAEKNSDMNLITRPATVMSLSPDGVIAEVVLDGDDSSTPVGAQVIYPTGVIPGDRVLIMFVKPHGAFLMGRRGGDFDRWHYIGDTDGGDPPYLTGWTALAGTGWTNTAVHSFPCFRRHGRIVELRGAVTRSSGSSTDIFQLPGGYAPENTLLIAGVGALAGFHAVQIEIDGTVSVPDGHGTLYMDGIMFSTNVVEGEV